uniref:Opioid growth factor receptor (OGFr) conserved domain-containing protein n=1 Tax=Pundamilia nyererei TaxID=303518 RepID=A0A3B4GRM3_9CICH
MAWFRNKSSASPYSTLDRKVDRNESKTSTENEDSFRSLSEDAEGDVSEGQHEADEGRESGRKLPGPEEEEFDSREHGAGTTVGYSGFRSLRDWIVRRTQMVFGPLTFSKKDRNESETSDDNTRALKNSPDDFHKKWYRDYKSLEYVHTYIQWLFPLQEPGVNYEASTLTTEEITDFLNHSIAKKNLLKSYKLMLDFYGIVLCDEKTGKVKKAEHWEERFDNLNSHTHNSLRITRILKCLGNLGYRHYQAPLVRFFLEETLVNGQLPNIRDSVLSYFMFAVLDKKKRRGLIKYAYLNYEPKDEFVWCPKKIQKLWSMQPKAAKEEAADSLESQEDTVISDSETDPSASHQGDLHCEALSPHGWCCSSSSFQENGGASDRPGVGLADLVEPPEELAAVARCGEQV